MKSRHPLDNCVKQPVLFKGREMIEIFASVTWLIGLGVLVYLIPSIMIVFAAILWTLICAGFIELIEGICC